MSALPMLKAPRHFAFFALFLASLGISCAGSLLAGPEQEPVYYIYHGEQKVLTLDTEHVAVRVSPSVPPAQSAAALPMSLVSRGFTQADVAARPEADWMIVNARSISGAPSLANQLASPVGTAQSAASAVHATINLMLNSGDPTIEFVSPVFRDDNGDPIIVTPTILIGFNRDVAAKGRASLRASVAEGAQVQKLEFPQPNDERWQIQSRDGFAVLNRANSLATSPGVAYAEPDMLVTARANLIPNDQIFGVSWGLRNTGQSGGQSGFDMGATAAWDITIGDPSVIVLVLDVGVQQDHPDINQVTGKDFTSDAASNPNGGPFGQYDNHGTWVAGCVSEQINNGIGTAGIAPGVKVASARCYNNGQANGSFSFQFSWVVDALNWGQSIGARVTNNSNGYGSTSSAIESAYASTRAAGMVHFAAAGNSGAASISYPASISSVNAVGAVNRFGQRSSFSQYGTGLKFMAPGEEIYTADRTGSAGGGVGDYLPVSGTSFASPYVAGIAALIISQTPSMTAEQVENQLQASCRDMGTAGYDTDYGYGMPNAYLALSAPSPPPTPTPTPTATPTPTPTPIPGNSSNILVSIGNPLAGSSSAPEMNSVREFTPDGTFVRATSFNYNNTPYPGTEYLRDIVLDQNGWIDGFNGTFNPFLTRYSPASNTFTHTSFSDWNTANSAVYGGIAAFKNFIYVTDSSLYSSEPGGIVRFDTSNNAVARFGYDAGFGDLNLGLDGKLYALTSRTVFVYDPVTMSVLRTISLPMSVWDMTAIAVDQTSHFFICGSSGIVYRLDTNGVVEASKDTGFTYLSDIDIDETGRIIIGQLDGHVIVGDSTLNNFASFLAVNDPNVSRWTVFVAFARSIPIKPSQPLNVSTRLRVDTGDNVMIGGFVITGNSPKKVIVRGIGPSLAQYGLSDPLVDPVLELHGPTGSLIVSNDNWRDAQESDIQASGLAPQNDLESAIIATLSPGSYTAIVKGNNDTTGLGLVEVYDLDSNTDSKLGNVSTRGLVQTGDNVMIGGFVFGGSPEGGNVIARAIGPSLTQYGVSGALQDPVLELHDASGTLIAQNDDWKSTQQQAITDSGLAPTYDHESAILATLQPGNYTAIVHGKNNTTGVALVEIYNLEPN